MRVKIVHIFVVLCCVSILQAQASPVTGLSVTYRDGQVLIKALHPSVRLERHYIKKVVITRNKTDHKDFFFTRQADPARFESALSVEAKTGDVLDIELYCSQGGVSKERLELP